MARSMTRMARDLLYQEAYDERIVLTPGPTTPPAAHRAACRLGRISLRDREIPCTTARPPSALPPLRVRQSAPLLRETATRSFELASEKICRAIPAR